MRRRPWLPGRGDRGVGVAASDWLNSADNCSGSNKCINGYFTSGIIPGGSSPGGAYLGAAVIRITG